MQRAIKSTLFGALFGVCATAAAEDLPSKHQSRTDSLSGVALSRARTDVKKQDRTSRHDVAQLLGELRGRKLAQANAEDASVGAVWTDELEPSRRILRRVLPNGTMHQPMGHYRNRTVSFTDASAASRAGSIVDALTSLEGVTTGSERFVPESTRIKRFRGMSASTGQSESFVVAVQVVSRRYLGDVPILGPEGEAFVSFDADGSLVEVDFPMTAYVGGRSKATGAAPHVRLRDGFTRDGFSQAPTQVGQILHRKGTTLELLDVQCGYRDDPSHDELITGCTVATSDAIGGPRMDFVPIEIESRPSSTRSPPSPASRP